MTFRRRWPTYAITLVALNGALGLIRLLESTNRTQSPAYRLAKQAMNPLPFWQPMRWWGALFVAVAVATVLTHRSEVGLRLVAAFGVGLWFFWAALLASSAYLDGRSSYAGAVVYTAGAVRHYQVARGK
jgi:hypothetical protein